MSGACGERFRAAVAGWPPAAQLLGFTNVPEEHAPDAAQALLRAIGSLLPTASHPLTAPDKIGAESQLGETMADAKVETDAILDATGLLCPLPVLKARRALKPLPAGAVLEVLATDPGATKDFEHFCQTTGCQMLEASELEGGVLRFRLKKPG